MSGRKVLLLENISANAKANLENAGYEVELVKTALQKEELIVKIADVCAVGLRSKTIIDADVLAAAKKLEAIGCFCIGTNQVDLEKAQELGIPVFNSPFCNSRSVAELIIGNLVFLARKLGDHNTWMHAGNWAKSAAGCYEIRGKTLGIVGYGHIGSQLSILAEAMGLNVIYSDISLVMALGNSKRVELDELLATADFVTLHVPATDQTHMMIKAREIGLMKEGAYLLNASRGTVVDVEALAEALKSGHLAGAYVDVYPSEPKGHTKEFKTPLQGCPNCILSPHIGGSTKEAQMAIGNEVSNKWISFFSEGKTEGAVNFPNVALPSDDASFHRIISIHQNVPGFMRSVNEVLCNYNISAQVLRTRGTVGFFIADVDGEISIEVATQIENLSGQIKTKVLF